MKIIDLLNKIANGEEVQQFEYYGGTYRKSKKDDRYWCNDMWFEFDIDDLNDEVEILEEPKGIPEKLYQCLMDTDNNEIEFLLKNINIIIDRYNDLLDYLESKGE